MTLEELRDATRVRLGVPSNDTFYQDIYLDDLLNEALAAISTAFDWTWLQATELINTVAGTRFYSPVDPLYMVTKAVSIQGYDAMTWVDMQTIRNWPDDTRDVPQYYTIWLNQIYMAPAPSAVYAIRHDYLKREPVLDENGDTPLMPSVYHYAIIAHAVHLGFLRAGDLPRAAQAKNEADAWIDRMLNGRIGSTSTLRVRVRPGRDF